MMSSTGACRVFGTMLLLALACSRSAEAQARALPKVVHTDAIQRISLAQRLLAAHNAERRAMGVRPLAWDTALAQSATVYAQQLAAAGTFQHSDRSVRRGIGENLWTGSRGAFSPEHMIAHWASEKRWYRPGTFPDVSRTGRWAEVAHYTQIIWSRTTKVGCGISSGRGRDVLVCRYSPNGNLDGRRVT